MTRILLVRHGLSEWNASGRWQGWADAPLAEVGERQAADAAHAVGAVDAVAASDLQRAHRTAEIIAEALGVGPVHVDPGLRERDAGEFEGLTRDEIEERFPGALRTSPVHPPGAEPLEVLLERALAAVHRLAALVPGGDVLAVAHGGLIRQVERHLGLEPSPVPNLGGRWLEVAGADVRPGERVLLLDPEHATVTVPRQL
jgi:broad specificity phosphatase PhoE